LHRHAGKTAVAHITGLYRFFKGQSERVRSPEMNLQYDINAVLAALFHRL